MISLNCRRCSKSFSRSSEIGRFWISLQSSIGSHLSRIKRHTPNIWTLKCTLLFKTLLISMIYTHQIFALAASLFAIIFSRLPFEYLALDSCYIASDRSEPFLASLPGISWKSKDQGKGWSNDRTIQRTFISSKEPSERTKIEEVLRFFGSGSAGDSWVEYNLYSQYISYCFYWL